MTPERWKDDLARNAHPRRSNPRPDLTSSRCHGRYGKEEERGIVLGDQRAIARMAARPPRAKMGWLSWRADGAALSRNLLVPALAAPTGSSSELSSSVVPVLDWLDPVSELEVEEDDLG